jgi:predicted nucleic acid-binding Zn ribbon protein
MKNCIKCGAQVIGRSDKKFCSDECKTTFNNNKYRERYKMVISINKILRKNYSILYDLYIHNKLKIKENDLLRLGFDYNYYTSIYLEENNSKHLWYECYDISYLIIEKKVLIVKNN